MLVANGLVRAGLRLAWPFGLVFTYAAASLMAINLAASGGYAQQASAASASRPAGTIAKPTSDVVIPAGVRAVLDTLPDVPPEFHANALLLLAESNQKLDRATRLKFIREAWEQAASASVPVKKKSGVMLMLTDSEAGRRDSAYGLNLDRVSLLSRATMDLAFLDPSAAHKLGNEMRLPEMPPVACDSAMVYDPKAYYAAVQVLARDRSRVPATPNRSTVDLLTPAVRELRTHTQVPLVFQLLNEANLSPNELETLTGEFITHLSLLDEDERGFAAEMIAGSAIDRVRKLYDHLEKNSPGSGWALLKDYRTYLVENYRVGGCGQLWRHLDIQGATDDGALKVKIQNFKNEKDPNRRSLPDNIRKFNDTFHDVLDSAGTGPILFNEVDADRAEVAAEQHQYWTDPDATALLNAAKGLRFDGHDQERTEDERKQSAWRAQAITYMGKVDDWKADPSRSFEVLWEKDQLYQAVMGLAPQADVQSLATEKSLAMVEDSGLEGQDPAAWMDLALSIQRQMIRSEKSRQPTAFSSKLTKRFVDSSNASLRLIGYLDALGIDPRSSGPLGK